MSNLNDYSELFKTTSYTQKSVSESVSAKINENIIFHLKPEKNSPFPFNVNIEFNCDYDCPDKSKNIRTLSAQSVFGKETLWGLNFF